MALRPVPDPPSEDTVDGAVRSELDAMATLVSEESRLHALPATPATPVPTTPQFVMIDRNRASAPVPRRTVAGWYPDDDDPSLKRYWDGHHLTGQTIRVNPDTTGTADPPAPPVLSNAPAPTARVGAVQRPAVVAESWTTLRTDDGLPPAPDRPTVVKPAAARMPAAGGTAVTAAGPPKDTPDLWADKVVAAVARARADGTTEGWDRVVEVVGVLSELARTMAVAASAAHASEHARRAAEAARKDAEAGAEAADAAKVAEREAAERARQAQDAAKAAAERAAEAKETARKAEREAPELAAVAETAAQEAAAAEATSEEIARIVAEARSADTPESWAEALRLAAAAAS